MHLETPCSSPTSATCWLVGFDRNKGPKQLSREVLSKLGQNASVGKTGHTSSAGWVLAGGYSLSGGAEQVPWHLGRPSQSSLSDSQENCPVSPLQDCGQTLFLGSRDSKGPAVCVRTSPGDRHLGAPACAPAHQGCVPAEPCRGERDAVSRMEAERVPRASGRDISECWGREGGDEAAGVCTCLLPQAHDPAKAN